MNALDLSPTLLLVAGVAGIFLAIGLALSVIGVATAEKRQIGRSLAALEAFSSAPKEMIDKELDRPFAERVLDADARAASPRSAAGSPARTQRRGSSTASTSPATRSAGTSTACSASRLSASPPPCCSASIVIVILGPRHRATPSIVCVGLSLLGFTAPNFYIYQKGYDRSEQMQKDLPDALDLMTISVEAGLAFDAALSRVAQNTEGPAGRGVRPRAAGDEHRHGSHRRDASPRRAHPHPRAQVVRHRDGAGRRVRYPDRPGACACSRTRCGSSVASAPRRRPRRCRSRSSSR